MGKYPLSHDPRLPLQPHSFGILLWVFSFGSTFLPLLSTERINEFPRPNLPPSAPSLELLEEQNRYHPRLEGSNSPPWRRARDVVGGPRAQKVGAVHYLFFRYGWWLYTLVNTKGPLKGGERDGNSEKRT